MSVQQFAKVTCISRRLSKAKSKYSSRSRIWLCVTVSRRQKKHKYMMGKMVPYKLELCTREIGWNFKILFLFNVQFDIINKQYPLFSTYGETDHGYIVLNYVGRFCHKGLLISIFNCPVL